MSSQIESNNQFELQDYENLESKTPSLQNIRKNKGNKNIKNRFSNYAKILFYLFIIGLVFLSIIFTYTCLSSTKKLNRNEEIKLSSKDSSLSKSKIIKEEKEFDLIFKALSQTKIFQNKSKGDFDFNLLYNIPQDFYAKRVFHEKCDDKNNTLFIIKTKEGKVFGAFTTQNWNTQKYSYDNGNAFGFSFVTMKYYPVIDGKYAIYSKNTEPEFIGLFFFPTIFLDRGITYHPGYAYSGITENNEISGGQEHFEVSELEVFQVNLKN